MNPDLNRYVADALVADRVREAARFRRSRVGSREAPDSYDAVTVRLARPVDAAAVVRLSELEGRRAPAGPTLVAEVYGTVLAARSLENGASVADPFRPSAQLTELLELRSLHLKDAAAPARRHRARLGPRAWLRAIRRGRVRGRSEA